MSFPLLFSHHDGERQVLILYFGHVCVSDGQSNRGTVCGERVPTEEGAEVDASLWADSTYAVIAMQVQLILLCI